MVLVQRCLLGMLLVAAPLSAQTRWTVDPDGGIAWSVRSGETHQDQIEMSGRRISAIITYGVRANGSLSLTRQVVFPWLRTLPNDTHASLSYTFGEDASPRVFVGGRPAREVVMRLRHRGLITVDSTLGNRGDIELTRTIFPSRDKPLLIEKYAFTNRSAAATTVEVENTEKTARTSAARGLTGEYVITSDVPGAGVKTVGPGERVTFALVFTAREARGSPLAVQVDAEEEVRRAQVEGLFSKLRLETPAPILNTAFNFAKLRTTESVFATKGGLMHGPGGGAYYAAVWANDQAEYANPFFPFLGDATANEAAINAFRLFARYMNPDYTPIPSSIIAEGTSFWNGAGDRGDMAMIAYGAARFALAYGDRAALYALRGVLAAGETERAMDFLTRYSTRRLLGEHVPYPVEAWPEGNQRHLAAESALYCRVFTEGLFGIRPSGLRSFTATPRLPRTWDRMALRDVHAFGGVFDLVVTRVGPQVRIDTVREGKTIDTRTVPDGDTITVSLRTP